MGKKIALGSTEANFIEMFFFVGVKKNTYIAVALPYLFYNIKNGLFVLGLVTNKAKTDIANFFKKWTCSEKTSEFRNKKRVNLGIRKE
jgi:hypothetical protein